MQADAVAAAVTSEKVDGAESTYEIEVTSSGGENGSDEDNEPELITREEVESSKRVYRFIKHAEDFVLSLLALIVLVIPMLIVAFIVWVTSPGASPIFKQERVGLNGKTFKLWKFRSMIPNAESKLNELMSQNEMDGPVFKIKKDPRITPVGSFIRKTSIDELPQLVNILRGDMSIVGPRPALPREVEQYGDFERQRLLVRPGLTCYWQTHHARNEVSFEEWMKLDAKYVREYSFKEDWKLIFRTFSVIFNKEGE
ncbi:MAG: sugar transferase [Oscillospiraceae bacterium]|nr:sugar transferase [Oscillospiraceae bacterium]